MVSWKLVTRLRSPFRKRQPHGGCHYNTSIYILRDSVPKNGPIDFASKNHYFSIFKANCYLFCLFFLFVCWPACIFQVTKRNQVNNKRHFRSLKAK